MHNGRLDAEGTLAVAGRYLQGRDQRMVDAVTQAIRTCAGYSGESKYQNRKIKKNHTCFA